MNAPFSPNPKWTHERRMAMSIGLEHLSRGDTLLIEALPDQWVNSSGSIRDDPSGGDATSPLCAALHHLLWDRSDLLHSSELVRCDVLWLSCSTISELQENRIVCCNDCIVNARRWHTNERPVQYHFPDKWIVTSLWWIQMKPSNRLHTYNFMPIYAILFNARINAQRRFTLKYGQRNSFIFVQSSKNICIRALNENEQKRPKEPKEVMSR